MAMGKQAKSLVTLLALVVVAGGLGAYAWFGVLKAEEAESAKKDAEAKAFDFDKASVKKLSLTAKGQTVQLEKDGEGWKITSPVATRADKWSVDPIVDKLADLKSKGTVADDQSKAADFGLDKPQFTVSATYADKGGAEKTLELNVGGENPLDLSLYFAKSGDAHVYMADASLKYPLDKGLFDLRDKSLVSFEERDVTSFTAQTDGAGWSVTKDGEGWKLTQPVQDAADKSAVDGVLSRLKNARAKSFAAEMPDEAALKAFGLDQPFATASFSFTGDRKATLQLGQVERDGGKKVYARLAEGGPVMEVEDGLAKELAKNLNELRDRTVSAFDREAVRKLEIQPLDGAKLVVTRTREKAANGEGETDKFAVDGVSDKLKTWKLSSALYTLSTLKGTSIVEDDAKDLAKYGLDKPNVTFVAYGEGDRKLAEILVGAQSGQKYYAAKAGSHRVFEVEKGTVDDVPRKKEDVVEAPPPAPAPANSATSAVPSEKQGG